MKKMLSVILLGLMACSIMAGKKPNIILISADDLGWSDIGCYGSEIKTPNLDRLANEGIRFTQFHNTSKCFPSRAAMITGVYAQDCGYHNQYTKPLKNAVTFGEVLQQEGYLTYWAGKHHGSENPYTRGFDHYFGLKDGCCNYFNPGNQREGEPVPARKIQRDWCIDSVAYKPYTPVEKDFYTTDYFTNYALDYIREAKDQDKPFFLNLAYTAPHDPLMAWPEDIKKYKGIYDCGYEKIRKARYKKQLQMGLFDATYRLSEPTYQTWDNLPEKQKRYEAQKMEVYAAMIDRMDQNIGRVLKELEKLDLMENTLILFVSDNGASAQGSIKPKDGDYDSPIGYLNRWISLGANWANVANTPFRYFKLYSYEGGINTPFIAYWPGKIKPNSFSRFPGHMIDIMATFVDITGAEYPKYYNGQKITPMRGESLVPVFKGKKEERKSNLFWQWKDGYALRKGDWKIVKHNVDKPWDLYNIKKDPTETVNLADQFPEKIIELNKIYRQWISQYE